MHPQTLRLYEREGLLQPSRTDGNTRLYTDEDIERLDVILSLTRDLGVNLAGVEIILNMRSKMDAMQRQMREFVKYVNSSMDWAADEGADDPLSNALIPLEIAPGVPRGTRSEARPCGLGVPRGTRSEARPCGLRIDRRASRRLSGCRRSRIAAARFATSRLLRAGTPARCRSARGS